MASDGTRVFVLGGYSKGARVDEMSLIHVLDTSTYAHFVNLSEQFSKLTQRTSSGRVPSLTLSFLMRQPPNLRGNHPQDPRPRSNHSTRHPLHRRLTVLPIFKTLPPLHRAALPPCRLLTSETSVRMVAHWNSRLWIVSQDVSRKTVLAKVQPSTMRNSLGLILLKKKLQC